MSLKNFSTAGKTFTGVSKAIRLRLRNDRQELNVSRKGRYFGGQFVPLLTLERSFNQVR